MADDEKNISRKLLNAAYTSPALYSMFLRGGDPYIHFRIFLIFHCRDKSWPKREGGGKRKRIDEDTFIGSVLHAL